MKRTATHGEEPLSMFALLVTGIEMRAIAAIIYYACTAPANVGHAATWFGEHTVDPREGPKGKTALDRPPPRVLTFRPGRRPPWCRFATPLAAPPRPS